MVIDRGVGKRMCVRIEVEVCCPPVGSLLSGAHVVHVLERLFGGGGEGGGAGGAGGDQLSLWPSNACLERSLKQCVSLSATSSWDRVATYPVAAR